MSNRLTDEQSQLAADHFKWSMDLAKRHAGKHRHLDLDFESAAAVGLIDAARNFDPSLGIKFPTYAARRVKGEMLDEMRRNRTLGYGRNPRPGDAPAILSIAAERQAGNPASLADTLSSGDEPVGWEIESEDAVKRIAQRLPSLHGKVMVLTYLHGLTREKVGRTLGFSKPYVCQVHDESLVALRHAVRPEGGQA